MGSGLGRQDSRFAVPVIFIVIGTISSATDARQPVCVVFVPVDGLLQPLVKRNRRLPAKFVFHFFATQCVTAVVSGPIRNIGKQRLRLVYQAKESAYDREIVDNVEATDIVDFAQSTSLEDGHDAT